MPSHSKMMPWHSQKNIDIMERLQEKFLLEAEADGRFSPQKTEYHLIRTNKESGPSYETFFGGLVDDVPPSFVGSPSDDMTYHSTLRCVFQRSRPEHLSGLPDQVPFRDASSTKALFHSLDLPRSYFQIADGSVATAQSHIYHDAEGAPIRFIITVYCLSKQGDWGMALSHKAKTKATAVFWNVDDQIDSDMLTEEISHFQDYSAHPVLLPCIMLSAVFRKELQRRRKIKDQVRGLERAIARITEASRPSPNSKKPAEVRFEDDDTADMGHLFVLLQNCRQEQASSKGRYDFLHSYYRAIREGFTYAEQALSTRSNERIFEVHHDLQQWAELVWQQLESLNARDQDHVRTVDNYSHMLYNMVQQRDMRLQSNIAKASQRDSEDMKFIAVLGSVFLPASLVATILNVPQFQFAEGGTLFGAYMGITIPFIILVVLVCFFRPHWSQWRARPERGSTLERRPTTMSFNEKFRLTRTSSV